MQDACQVRIPMWCLRMFPRAISQCACPLHPPRVLEPAALALHRRPTMTWRLFHSAKEPAALLTEGKGACCPLLTKEPAALLTPRKGACRPFLTKEPAALLLGDEEPAALAKNRHMPIVRKLRSLPPVHQEVREPAASHRRTRRPSAREPAAPCASPHRWEPAAPAFNQPHT